MRFYLNNKTITKSLLNFQKKIFFDKEVKVYAILHINSKISLNNLSKFKNKSIRFYAKNSLKINKI